MVRPMLTLRQIEVIRDIMVTGTVGDAARLLNVSSPGVNRIMKHAEASVGVKLFTRKAGRYSQTPEARAIFNQINGVYDKVEDLQFVISRIKRGVSAELRIGSVPSIANVMVPRAVADLRKVFPNLLIDIDILKLEDAVDYLLLGKGDLVALSDKFDHPMLAFQPLARGRLKCITPEGHPLSRRSRVTAREIAKYPLSERPLCSHHVRPVRASHAQLRSADPRAFRFDGLRTGDAGPRNRGDGRVHACRRPVAQHPRP